MSDIREGLIIKLEEGEIGQVVSRQYVKPSGGPSFMRAKVKEFRTGKVVDKVFTADTEIGAPEVERRDMHFLYEEDGKFIFMDKTNFDQLTVEAKAVGDGVDSLTDNLAVTIVLHGDEALYVDLARPV
ncbi:hypothetical protein [Streptomyces sp. NPDC056492]|uniref:hypothetical protein n=1 Tax=unclassified Streptomyces TaxID=2593676 RepID=UPI0036B7595D